MLTFGRLTLTNGHQVEAFNTHPGETHSGQVRLPEGLEAVQRQVTLAHESPVCVCIEMGVARSLLIYLSIK